MYMEHMVFTMFVYLRKYVYIGQLQITNALSSSLSFHLSHSRSHKQKIFRENVNGIGERICYTSVCLLVGAEQCKRISGDTQAW
jgi:hypothetical protein